MLEGLEIDQFLWGILSKFHNCPEIEEVNIDQSARVKPVANTTPPNPAAAPGMPPAVHNGMQIKKEFETSGKS